MPKISIVAGTTSKLLDIFIQDSSSTTGAGLTGLVFNTGSLTAYYYREGAASATAITLATMTLGTWATSGFVVVDGTNMPGVYQLGIPNAAIAAGAKSVIIMLKGATNMAPVVFEVELTAVDNQDAVRGGMTALPNANAAAANGLHVLGTNATAVSYTGGMTISNATGSGLTLSSGGSNGSGLATSGNGSGHGILSTGGATGHGVSAVGGATSGDGISAAAATSGHGVTATGVGTTKHGVNATGGATTSDGIRGTGGGAGHGMNLVAGATGNGLRVTTSAGDGISVAPTAGHAMALAGNGTTKHGLHATGGATTSHGINAVGGGVGHGILATSGGGATGDGIRATAASVNGNGVNYQGVGTGAGELATGGATGVGISGVGGASSGSGIKATGTAGNAIGLQAVGQGSAAGINATGGATGHGVAVVGGGTSGDGVNVVTTSGHGINLSPVGTSKHGLFATGGNGGTSDGISAVAGTGGVPIRGNITGNLTGNVSGSVGSVATGGIAAASFAAGAIDAAAIAMNAIDADALAADAVAEIAAAILVTPANLLATNASGFVTVVTNNDKTGYRLSATGVDDILDEAVTEPVGVFTWAGATLRTIIGWLGALSRNRIEQTTTTQTLFADDLTTPIATASVSDDGTTARRDEWT